MIANTKIRPLACLRGAGCIALALAMAPPALAATTTRQSATFDARLGAAAAPFGLPGVTGAYFRTTGSITIGAAGVRRLGDPAPTQATDEMHIGSNVKAMTATLMATLVKDGKISWSTTLAEALPALAADMNPRFRSVTIKQLMSMTGGVTPVYTLSDALALPVTGDTPHAQRINAARMLLADAPIVEPGTSTVYSNGAYAVAGAIIETKLGTSWEAALQARVLAPLDIVAHTGWPAAGGVDAPWGHLPGDDGALFPVDPEGPFQIPAFGRPAGDLTTTAAGLATFAQAHLQGLRGIGNGLGLAAADFAELHTSVGELALGWKEYSLGNNRLSFFDGSTDLFNGAMIINRDRGIGAVVLYNGYISPDVMVAAFDTGLDAGLGLAVPEPTTWLLMVSGFGLVGWRMRRHNNQNRNRSDAPRGCAAF